MSEPTRDALRSRFLKGFPQIRPLPAQGQVQTAYERRPRVRADERCIGYVEYSEEPLPDPLPAKLVAFYLPQFHTIPENDEWWGKGFTEWRNVTRALPQFEGHLQPRLPGDLGFYDLRNPQVMRDQAKLAKTYGLSAFCFYFYWFGGKTLLEEPLRAWLADTSIDFEYCLCWANESWTRRWDGREQDILISQNHSPKDDIAFIEHLAPFLRDPRYLRVDGRPLLLLYRPLELPDPKATAFRWRQWCRDEGIGEIHLAYVQSFERPDPEAIGFDAAVEFPPALRTACELTGKQKLLNSSYEGRVAEWRGFAASDAPEPKYRLYRGINCGWDNEPRRPGRGLSFIGSTPTGYNRWLRQVTAASKQPIFINAWNEWAEGAVLEPDARQGYAYLAATRSALHASVVRTDQSRPCIIVHAWYPEFFEELLDSIATHADTPYRLLVTAPQGLRGQLQDITSRRMITAEFLDVENRGRDILPFLVACERLHRQGEQVVLKLHTKHSPHRRDGDTWRREMVSQLLHGGLRARFRQIAEAASVGMLMPSGHEVPLSYFGGANLDNVEALRCRLGLPPPAVTDTFASGSMFWVRPAAIAPFFEVLTPSDFDEERGQVDGTLAHAIERLFGHCVRSQGFQVESAGCLVTRQDYPFA